MNPAHPPSIVIPPEVYLRLDLTPFDKLVYGIVMLNGGATLSGPSIARLCRETGVSRGGFYQSLKYLAEAGLFTPEEVSKAPAQMTEVSIARAPAQKAPAQMTEAPAQMTEVSIARAPAQKAPAQMTEAPAQMTEVSIARAPAQKAPAQMTELSAQKAPAQMTEAPAQKAPRVFAHSCPRTRRTRATPTRDAPAPTSAPARQPLSNVFSSEEENITLTLRARGETVRPGMFTPPAPADTPPAPPVAARPEVATAKPKESAWDGPDPSDEEVAAWKLKIETSPRRSPIERMLLNLWETVLARRKAAAESPSPAPLAPTVAAPPAAPQAPKTPQERLPERHVETADLMRRVASRMQPEAVPALLSRLKQIFPEPGWDDLIRKTTFEIQSGEIPLALALRAFRCSRSATAGSPSRVFFGIIRNGKAEGEAHSRKRKRGPPRNKRPAPESGLTGRSRGPVGQTDRAPA